jgi:hypothetical protein
MKPHPPGAVASLAYGICAILTGGAPLVGAILGIIAVIESRRAVTNQQQQMDRYQATGLPAAGMVTGIIGIVLSVLSLLWMVIVFGIIGLVVSSLGHMEPLPPVEPALRW